ncbi:MAG: hypothetical protein JWM80_2936 [Cyanobacteria bacterium RYN_339]|nr:hypothetical protein [Cyanobacteria bacterium RYN_339]
MLTPHLSRLAAMAAITTLLAGCGQVGSMLAAKTADGSATQGFGGHRGGPGGHGEHGGPGGPGGPGGFLFGLQADLALTADQQTQLKAIFEKNKPSAPPSHDANDAHKKLQDILLGEKIDDAALRAAIAAVEADRANHPHPDMGANLKAVYDILTVEQRAKIVAKLQAAPAGAAPSPRPTPSGDPKAAQLAKLNLTADQKAALDALDAKRKADHKPGDRRAAMLAFWQTGDASGLAAPKPPAFPVEEFVKAAELLDQTQRKALFAHGFPGGPGGHGHGGHGGPGGHGGFGGHEGPGGPGGFPGFGGHEGHGGPGGFPGFGGHGAPPAAN